MIKMNVRQHDFLFSVSVYMQTGRSVLSLLGCNRRVSKTFYEKAITAFHFRDTTDLERRFQFYFNYLICVAHSCIVHVLFNIFLYHPFSL